MALTTYSQYQALETSEKVVLVVLEAAKRLVGWSVHSGSVYRCVFTDSDVVTSIEENGTALTAVASIAAVSSAGKYYHDRANGYIYLRASDSANPNGHVEACTFKLFYSNVPIKAPYDLSTGFDVQWLPYVKSTSEFGVELDNYNQFGLAIEGNGSIQLYNDQAYWETRYDKLTFENQRAYIYSWNRDLPIAQAKLIYRGRVQRRSWSLDVVGFELRDQLNELRAPISLSDLTDISGARIATNLQQCKQRLIYGRLSGHKPVSYKQVLTGYPLTGTVAVTNGNATVTGTSTTFLTELSPNDQIVVGSSTVKATVKSVDSDTQVTLTQTYQGTTASGASATVVPSHPKRYANRNFSVAGHALREPTTTVTSSTNATQFVCADLTDFEAGDPVIVGSEAGVVRRVSGTTLVLAGPLNAVPTAGTTVTRPAISNVYLNDRLLTLTTDYTYSASAGTLTLLTTAEFNVAPILGISGTLAFTNTSRTVTGTSTTFKKDVKPGDWVRRQGQTSWFEVLSVESDTSLTLRSASTYTSSGAADLKSPAVYDEGKDVVLSCDVLGTTVDGLTTGALLKTAGGIVKDLLTKAGLSAQLNTSTFTQADADCEWTLGLAIPETFNAKTVPSYKDVIHLVNKSVFGSLVQNEDFQLEYTILSPARSTSSTKLRKPDVVKFSVETDSDKLVKTVLVDYLPKEWDYTSSDTGVSQVTATSETGNYLAKSTKEFSIKTYLVSSTDAQIYADRWAFILGVGTTVLKFTSRLQAARLQATDVVEVQHDKLYQRVASTDTARVGSIRFVKQNGFDVSLELEDLGNAFARCGTITSSSASDYSSATVSEKRYNGYITDSYGMQSNDPDTHGVSLIW